MDGRISSFSFLMPTTTINDRYFLPSHIIALHICILLPSLNCIHCYWNLSCFYIFEALSFVDNPLLPNNGCLCILCSCSNISKRSNLSMRWGKIFVSIEEVKRFLPLQMLEKKKNHLSYKHTFKIILKWIISFVISS